MVIKHVDDELTSVCTSLSVPSQNVKNYTTLSALYQHFKCQRRLPHVLLFVWLGLALLSALNGHTGVIHHQLPG